ncbi:MAG: DUF3843 family protein [Muribaculaceae bacterium]|nr:DUF3843 family protein [Muribaculaceae bacterium]
MDNLISKQDFLAWQPNYPNITETDPYYWELANTLAREAQKAGVRALVPDSVIKRMALCVTGYFQDIASDSGIWRSFIEANRALYGWSVPFHSIPEEYVDYELNREDVRFLVWYSLAMSYEDMRDIYPHDSKVLELADIWYEHLERIYEEAPAPESYNISRGLDFNDNDDSKEIYHLGQWLFLHCYLLTPAFALSLGEILSDPEIRKPENFSLLHDRLEQSMMQDPTGPLALFIPEWLYLILNGKLLKKKEENVGEEIHPYYKKFTKATDGKILAFFDTYESMNRFFIEKLGWEAGEEHLPMMKGSTDFVLMVNKHKGMLAARNVAKCIASPDNPYYDREYAESHAFELLSVRGLCPGDLLKVIFENNWLPDARFPGTDDTKLVADNHDFIARCYLQQYYHGD